MKVDDFLTNTRNISFVSDQKSEAIKMIKFLKNLPHPFNY